MNKKSTARFLRCHTFRDYVFLEQKADDVLIAPMSCRCVSPLLKKKSLSLRFFNSA